VTYKIPSRLWCHWSDDRQCRRFVEIMFCHSAAASSSINPHNLNNSCLSRTTDEQTVSANITRHKTWQFLCLLRNSQTR